MMPDAAAAMEGIGPSPPAGPGGGHFLAKDYASFRAMLLADLETRVGNGMPRDPASIEIMLVEALAYVADYMSYHQDAVATEAYLATARLRLSVSRHARLLGYPTNEGCSARAFVQFVARADGVTIGAGAQLLARIDGVDTVTVPADYAIDERVVFETLHAIELRHAHNRIALAAATPRAGDVATRCAGVLDGLAPGDVLVLSHAGGWAHPVRLVEVAIDGGETSIRWHDDDAVPATIPPESGLSASRLAGRSAWTLLGNIALAQHGRTTWLPLPALPPEEDAVTLPCGDLGYAERYDHTVMHRAAAAALTQNPHHAAPLLALAETLPGFLGRRAPGLARQRPGWQGTRSLVGAGPSDRLVAVEPLDADHVRLSFGDGVHGRHPVRDLSYVAEVRIGRGVRGNIGPNTLVHLVDADPRIASVTNPLAAVGGADPESLDAVRAAAPAALLDQQRCVTDEDFEAAAREVPSIRLARARRERTRTRDAVTVVVARTDDGPVSDALARHVETRLRSRALIGQTVAVAGVNYVVPSFTLILTLARGSGVGDVEPQVRAALRALRFGFGEPADPDTICAAALTVAGVQDAALDGMAGTAALAMPPLDQIVRIDPDRVLIVTIDARAAP